MNTTFFYYCIYACTHRQVVYLPVSSMPSCFLLCVEGMIEMIGKLNPLVNVIYSNIHVSKKVRFN
jgi:hypothetical protein